MKDKVDIICVILIIFIILTGNSLICFQFGQDSMFAKANKAGVAIKQIDSSTGNVEVVFGQFNIGKKCIK